MEGKQGEAASAGRGGCAVGRLPRPAANEGEYRRAVFCGAWERERPSLHCEMVSKLAVLGGTVRKTGGSG